MDSEIRRQLREFLQNVLPDDPARKDAGGDSLDPPGASVESSPSSSKKASAKRSFSGGTGRDGPAALRRFCNWAVTAAALVLIIVAAYGIFFHREQLKAVFHNHVRLMIVGPSAIQAGLPAEYAILTTTLEGRPISTDVEITISDSSGKPLKAYRAPSGEQGCFHLTIPSGMQLPSDTHLAVSASLRNGERQTAKTNIVVMPLKYQTHLTLDKTRYQPGETVRYRSLTLSQFALAPCKPTSVQFEILDSSGTATPKSLQKATTDRGAAGGDFTLPDALPDGRYALVFKSNDGSLPTRTRTFTVQNRNAAEEKPPAVEARMIQKKKSSVANKGIHVTFYPEGGELAAKVENRVYFFAQHADGRPAIISGAIVRRGASDDYSPEIAKVQTSCDGMGQCDITPSPGYVYCLKISEPADATKLIALPNVEENGATLNAGIGVFSPGEPIEFIVRTRKAGLPLVAAAYCRGALVAQQMLSINGLEETERLVSFSLNETAVGAVRICVFDYAAAPPRLLAERLVYRRPRQNQLESLTLDNSPTDAGDSDASRFLLTDSLTRLGGTITADQFLSDTSKGKTPASAALDLLLATQNRPKNPCPPPLIYDNLRQIRADYEKSLANYRADRSPALSAWVAASLYGAVGLVFFTVMAVMLRASGGLYPWIPALVALACCLTAGIMLSASGHPTTGPEASAAYVPYHAPPSKSDASAAADSNAVDASRTSQPKTKKK